MPTDALSMIAEAVTRLSTQVLFLLLLGQFAMLLIWVLFAADLMSVLLAALMRRVAEHHLAMRPMAEALGLRPPYHRHDRNAVFATFLRGLEASGIQSASAPPRPPDP